LLGFGLALACIFGLLLVSLALQGASVSVPENERALEIAKSVTLLGALGIAAGAAISEEVFFRGFLQPRIGVVAQAVLFGLAHLSYVNVLEVVVTLTLGLLFGLVYRSTRNLYAPIAAHFLFNLIMLVIGIYAPEATT
jgi:membrane protease YdiL (CAAX protease family)